jgi:hypothetical protein
MCANSHITFKKWFPASDKSADPGAFSIWCGGLGEPANGNRSINSPGKSDRGSLLEALLLCDPRAREARFRTRARALKGAWEGEFDAFLLRLLLRWSGMRV